MNRKSFIFALVALILPTIAIMAQDDDDEMYFGRKTKNDKAVQTDRKQQPRKVVVVDNDDVARTSDGEADYHTGTLRDVDEYNRLLAALYQALTDTQAALVNARADYIGDDSIAAEHAYSILDYFNMLRTYTNTDKDIALYNALSQYGSVMAQYWR